MGFYERLDEKTPKEAARFVNAMGALTVTEKGSIPSLHTKKQVE